MVKRTEGEEVRLEEVEKVKGSSLLMTFQIQTLPGKRGTPWIYEIFSSMNSVFFGKPF